MHYTTVSMHWKLLIPNRDGASFFFSFKKKEVDLFSLEFHCTAKFDFDNLFYSKWKKKKMKNLWMEASFPPSKISSHLSGKPPSYGSKCQVMSVHFHATLTIMSFFLVEVLITIGISYNFSSFLWLKSRNLSDPDFCTHFFRSLENKWMNNFISCIFLKLAQPLFMITSCFLVKYCGWSPLSWEFVSVLNCTANILSE